MDQGGTRATSTERLSFKRSNRIKAVNCANTYSHQYLVDKKLSHTVFIKATKDVESIVGEETASIQDNRGQLGNGTDVNIFTVLIIVHLQYIDNKVIVE